MTRTRLAAAVFVMAVLFSGPGCDGGAPSSTPSPSLRSGTAPPSATALAFAPTATSTLTPAPPALSEIQECGASPNVILLLSRATVLRVIDGDTIVLADGQRVRYIGIDTPELGPPEEYYAREATSANRQLVEGKEVALEKDTSETDRFGRLLRYVYVDGTFVNAELVWQGYAEAVAHPPDIEYQSCLKTLERKARGAGRGIWSRRYRVLRTRPLQHPIQLHLRVAIGQLQGAA